jgi:single-strand DNA-binding protein
MQANVFGGKLAKAATVTGTGNKAVTKFTLITNEYAGKDNETQEARERVVSLQFTAFGAKGETIARTCFKGDQLFINYRVENNNYEKSGEKVYSYNFVVESFEYGAPGPEKRAHLANQEGQ